jgi:hypothetical protein
VTDVRRLLDAVRSELRSTILPKIEGEYERSVVIAMLGILGDLRDAVAIDERPAAKEAAELAAACDEWIAALGERPLANRLRETAAAADATKSAIERRSRLLEAAEMLVRELWSDPSLAAMRKDLLPRVRQVLKR